ncbi:MAG: B12-binding domain-containing radical SAM protein [Desulfobacterales bacterium]|nr:MAG: B12-binding domain-containing radical SAM protein [Desulfobacterales bacterium]
MKILLLSANILKEPYPVYPVGLDHVARSLAPAHEAVIRDMNCLGDPGTSDELIREIQRIRPNAVGLSLRNIDNTDWSDPRGFIGWYRHIVEAVRTAGSWPLILGGSGFTLFPDALMTSLGADWGVIGEGERLTELLSALESGYDPSDLPGVVVPGRPAVLPDPWDGFFSPLVSAESPHISFYIERGGMMNLQTKRGCPFRCIYCTYPRIEGRRLRPIDPEKTASAAMELERAGAKYLFLTDSVFNADYSHSRAVAEAFRKRGLSIPWGAFFAPSRPPGGYYAALKAAGLTHVEFGTETLSPPVLKTYGKHFKLADVMAAHGAARSAGLHIAHYFLFGGPGETPDTVDESLENIDRLSKTVLFFFCGMRIYPGTPLYDIALKEGQITADQDLLEPVYYRSRAISPEEILRKVRHRAAGRRNWVVGAGGDETAKMISLFYRKGYSGPLWEYLVR